MISEKLQREINDIRPSSGAVTGHASTKAEKLFLRAFLLLFSFKPSYTSYNLNP